MNTELFQEVPPVPPGTYEPHCLERWAEQVAAMDEMAGIQDEKQVK